jgi:DNA-binding NtrC family response regulator
MRKEPETTVRRPAAPKSKTSDVATLRLLFTPRRKSPPAPIVLGGGTTTIGRAAESTIALEDDVQTSRLHATLERKGTTVTLADASTNGTYVNGTRISKTKLADGDVIRVGDSLFLFRMQSSEAPIEPVAHGLLGDAPAMHELRRTLSLVGPSDAAVLVHGESGTGKELVARAVHRMSRPDGPFVAVNCAAIPEALAESQLFGHVTGAFTGAKTDSTGFFRAAAGGVLFLDEVGELQPALQPKLLRALEDGAITPVGATSPVSVDVRIVAATNRDLAREVREGRFRGDLHARLAEIVLRLPALRERKEDIVPLLVGSLGDDVPPLTADLVEALLLHPWPYNVRELFKIGVELRVRGRTASELDIGLVAERLTRPAAEPAASGPEEPPVPTRDELVALLRTHDGRIADVARAVGRSRKQVYRWIDSHGIDVEGFRRAR